ncbi:MAG: hypothetical protein H7039_10460 [Bryobacteraceae bacterium]|nr:hypothetical protein [Bryobacteraceae bacterium]
MRLLFLCALSVSSALAQEGGRGWWRGVPVNFTVVDGNMVTEGDILLEGVAREENAEEGKNQGRAAVVRNASRYLWLDFTVPYVIDPALSTADRVRDAVAHWNTNTPLRLVERTNEENYIRFVPRDGVCSSFVGMLGREQAINLGTNCSTGNIIHEIGHAVGMFHEQSRNDRDLWMQLLPENVDQRQLGNFEQVLSSGLDTGGYDYGSVMHYAVSDFSRNGTPGLRSIPAGIPVGQREGLSPADVDAIRRLYSVPTEETTIATFPSGLDVLVDGELVRSPRTYQWSPGSTHSLSVPAEQFSGTYRYVFGRWSNDGNADQQVVAGSGATVYTAAFVRQIRIPLTVARGRGRIEVTPEAQEGGWFPEGTPISVAALPESGWQLGGWSGTGAYGVHGASPNPLRFIARGTATQYAAVFTQAPLTTITSDPPNLQVQVDGRTLTTPEAFSWTPGTTHTIAVPRTAQTSGNGSAKHQFQGWTGDGPESQTITAGSESTSITARFQTQYNVFVQQSSGGRVDLTPQGADQFWEAGTTITARSLPQGANRLVGWGGDAGGAEEISTVIVDGQKRVAAAFSPPNQIAPGGLVNAASFVYGNGIAPGTLITIFGVSIGPADLAGLRLLNGTVATDLDGYRVTFDEFAAPLIYTASNQLSAVVPFGLAGRSQAVLRLIGPNYASGRVTVPVIPANPGIFTANSSGRGQAAALNQDGSVNSVQTPADKGSVVVLYATGAGVMAPAVNDGQVVLGSPTLPRPTLPVRVRINGQPAKLVYAGAAPDLVAGVLQVNVEIPSNCPSGVVPVSLAVGGAASAVVVTLAVR